MSFLGDLIGLDQPFWGKKKKSKGPLVALGDDEHPSLKKDDIDDMLEGASYDSIGIGDEVLPGESSLPGVYQMYQLAKLKKKIDNGTATFQDVQIYNQLAGELGLAPTIEKKVAELKIEHPLKPSKGFIDVLSQPTPLQDAQYPPQQDYVNPVSQTLNMVYGYQQGTQSYAKQQAAELEKKQKLLNQFKVGQIVRFVGMQSTQFPSKGNMAAYKIEGFWPTRVIIGKNGNDDILAEPEYLEPFAWRDGDWLKLSGVAFYINHVRATSDGRGCADLYDESGYLHQGGAVFLKDFQPMLNRAPQKLEASYISGGVQVPVAPPPPPPDPTPLERLAAMAPTLRSGIARLARIAIENGNVSENEKEESNDAK